jgi:hypothetical protein
MGTASCPQPVLLANGDGPSSVRPAVLRLRFCIMVIGLYEFGHIAID